MALREGSPHALEGSIPRADTTALACCVRRARMRQMGTFFVDFPGVCKHFGWSADKVCGPCAVALRRDVAEENCCYDHPLGSPLHKTPMVNGKPFVTKHHWDALVKKGLVKYPDELKEERKSGKKPPGQARKVGNVMVYPARHFA